MYLVYSSGPTLSTSTSSFEALDPHDTNLSRLATIMFQKTADYLYGELTATHVTTIYLNPSKLDLTPITYRKTTNF